MWRTTDDSVLQDHQEHSAADVGVREMLNYSDPVLETSVMGVDFVNPFGLSAGLDKNCEMPVLLDNAGFGFETVGSTRLVRAPAIRSRGSTVCLNTIR